MSTQGGRVVTTNALPPNNVKTLPPGATGIGSAVIIQSNMDNNSQNNLINGQNGGIRRRKRRMRGGAFGVADNAAPVVVVPAAPSYDTNPQVTNQLNTQLAGLANTVAVQGSLDGTVNQSQDKVTPITAAQQETYYGTGGSSKKKRKSYNKKGGTVPIWGCFSGGKKSRRHKKSCKCKRRKTHKRTRRHHH